MSGFWQYLFEVYPSPPVSDLKLSLALVVPIILLILFLLAPVLRKKTENKALKKILARSRTGLISYAIGIALLIWLRLEAVPFLSMRLWFFLVLLALIGWFGWKIHVYRKIKNRIEKAEARRKRK